MHRVFNLIVLALYGIPTLISGTILRFNPLKIGGICCWAFAALASFMPERYHLLVLGAAVIVAWIIPGYLLRKKFEQLNLSTGRF